MEVRLDLHRVVVGYVSVTTWSNSNTRVSVVSFFNNI